MFGRSGLPTIRAEAGASSSSKAGGIPSTELGKPLGMRSIARRPFCWSSLRWVRLHKSFLSTQRCALRQAERLTSEVRWENMHFGKHFCAPKWARGVSAAGVPCRVCTVRATSGLCSPDPRTSWTLMDGTEEAVEQLDRSIRHALLPQLTGQGAAPEEDLPLLYLPARLGGIGLPCLALVAAEELKASVEITKAQVDEILLQNDQARQPPQCVSVHNDALATRAKIRTARRKSQNDRQRVFRSSTPARRRQIELLAVKGCSAWLTALPLREHSFALNKQEFQDALAFRYGWEILERQRSACAERPSPPTMLWFALMEGSPP